MKQQFALEDEVEINMTAMLDIVFIMLIFFIVTAVFVKPSGANVVRPHSETAREVSHVSTLIGVTKDDEIWINKRQVALEEVRTVVTRLKQENPKGSVVITADQDSQSKTVVSIVDQLNQIGIAGVAIATRSTQTQ